MNFFCHKCNENHKFDLFQVERLVYGLQALFAEVESIPSQGETSDDGDDTGTLDRLICLQDALGFAQDQEMYGEHVRELVITRYREELEDWSIPLHRLEVKPEA